MPDQATNTVSLYTGGHDPAAVVRAPLAQLGMRESVLKCHKVSNLARWPEYGTEGAAGLDLFSARTWLIPSGERRLISTDISWELPEGCYARIASRSSLALNDYLDVEAGVIDFDYRGVVQVLLHNSGPRSYLVRMGDRVAQVIIEQILRPRIVPVVRLATSARGASGFGSTGR